jgi:hypothetical protein
MLIIVKNALRNPNAGETKNVSGIDNKENVWEPNNIE